MTRGKPVDRIALHERLWKGVNHFHKVEIHQKQLAKELKVTAPTMSLVISELVQEGRIRKIEAKFRNVGVYYVKDPATFPHDFEPKQTGIGVVRCKRCGELQGIGPHTRL